MKKIMMLLLIMSAVLFVNDVQVQASEVFRIEEYAEVTDIDQIIDEIEVIQRKEKAVTEDYRAWTQDDARWGNMTLGNSGTTVKKSGCLITSITKLIIQCELKKAEEFNPNILMTWMNKNGGFTGSGGLYWGKPAEYVEGLSYVGDLLTKGQYDSTKYDDQFIAWINQGYHLVVQVKDGGHWVAVDEKLTLENGTVYMMDSVPANVNADITLAERYPTFNRVGAYKGGTTPEVLGEAPFLSVEWASEKENDASILLTWKRAKDYFAGYTIERALNKKGPWEVVGTINKEASSWTDKKAKKDTTYYYRIQPRNEEGEAGTYSNIANITTKHIHTFQKFVVKKATMDRTGQLRYTCKDCGFEKYENISRINSVKLSATKFVYNGKVRAPYVTVTNKMGNKISDSFYKVTYIGGRKLSGTYKVKVEFTGRYKGTVEKTFKIVPKQTSITYTEGRKKAFLVEWKKVTSQVSGYQVRYSTDSNFKKNLNTKNVSYKYGSTKINVDKSNKTYYVKVRIYKTVNGVKYYGAWSSIDEVTTE